MKRLFSTLTGLVLLASAGGCCCDGCHWGCKPCCSPCGSGCAPIPGGGTYSAPMTSGAYESPAAPAVGLRSEERRVGKECRARWVREYGRKREKIDVVRGGYDET